MPDTAPDVRGRPASSARVGAALALVYVVWGSTYLGIRVVVQQIPPLLAMGARFAIAGLLAAAWVAVTRGPRALRLTAPELRSVGLVALLLIVIGNGFVAVGEQVVPSGLAALLVAGMPLWLVGWRRLGGESLAVATVVGTLLGVVGIGVLARPGSVDGVPLWGTLSVLGASVGWSLGTYLSPRLPLPRDAFVTTTYQMGLGGLGSLGLGLLLGERRDLDLAGVSTRGWVAFWYLVVAGLVAFAAYTWLVQHAPLSLVATYAFVNPVVAVALGAVLLDEPITTAVLVGGGLAVLGVALVVRGERR